MQSFDIGTLVDFLPPGYRCQNCLSLWRRDYWTRDVADSSCTYCGIKYVPDDENPHARISDYLRKEGYAIEFSDPLSHARDLAKIARNVALRENPPNPEYWNFPYLKALLQAFTVAQRFVHFVTFGQLPDFMIGVLKLAAQRVDVHGVVALPDGRNLSRLLRSVKDLRSEAGKLHVKVLASEGGDLPHQKLVVIDGIFAFKGSANLTDLAWRKAEDNKEDIEVVTDIGEVIQLNNRYFSPVWRPRRNEAGVRVTDAKGTRREYVISMYLGPYPWDDLDIEL